MDTIKNRQENGKSLPCASPRYIPAPRKLVELPLKYLNSIKNKTKYDRVNNSHKTTKNEEKHKHQTRQEEENPLFHEQTNISIQGIANNEINKFC